VICSAPPGPPSARGHPFFGRFDWRIHFPNRRPLRVVANPQSTSLQPSRPNSELLSSNFDQFFVSTLGSAKKRLGASDLTRGFARAFVAIPAIWNFGTRKAGQVVREASIQITKWLIVCCPCLAWRTTPNRTLLPRLKKYDQRFSSSARAALAAKNCPYYALTFPPCRRRLE
jgi:hypothetical protein